MNRLRTSRRDGQTCRTNHFVERLTQLLSRTRLTCASRTGGDAHSKLATCTLPPMHRSILPDASGFVQLNCFRVAPD